MLPRGFEYNLRVGLTGSSCAAFAGENGRLVSRENARAFSHEVATPSGPDIQLPSMFCQQLVAVQVVGNEAHVPEGLELQACTTDGELCTEMFRASGHRYEAIVPLPGPHVVEVTSDKHACTSYLAADGITPQTR